MGGASRATQEAQLWMSISYLDSEPSGTVSSAQSQQLSWFCETSHKQGGILPDRLCIQVSQDQTEKSLNLLLSRNSCLAKYLRSNQSLTGIQFIQHLNKTGLIFFLTGLRLKSYKNNQWRLLIGNVTCFVILFVRVSGLQGRSFRLY